MPVCYVTVSDKIPMLTSPQLSRIREIVALGLTSKSRPLDNTHISIRVQQGKEETMLGQIELDIFSQLYIRRLFSRDKRANYISECISKELHSSCATWINMGYVGYSRVTPGGGNYYSDSSNPFIRWIQKAKGISTSEKKN